MAKSPDYFLVDGNPPFTECPGLRERGAAIAGTRRPPGSRPPSTPTSPSGTKRPSPPPAPPSPPTSPPPPASSAVASRAPASPPRGRPRRRPPPSSPPSSSRRSTPCSPSCRRATATPTPSPSSARSAAPAAAASGWSRRRRRRGGLGVIPREERRRPRHGRQPRPRLPRIPLPRRQRTARRWPCWRRRGADAAAALSGSSSSWSTVTAALQHNGAPAGPVLVVERVGVSTSARPAGRSSRRCATTRRAARGSLPQSARGCAGRRCGSARSAPST